MNEGGVKPQKSKESLKNTMNNCLPTNITI